MNCRDQVITDRYAIYNGDTCKILPEMASESVHLSLYSPPFGSLLYQYSSDPADLSNCKDYAEFFDHYGFVIREIHRLTMPGRMTAVHCQDIAVMKGDEHHILDFPGDIIRCHRDNGWKYVARYHVWKEPLTVRNRTMVKSLHHKTFTEDSTKCSIANADYLLIFRRSGHNTVPVIHPVGLTRYAGSNPIPPELIKWRGWKGNQIKNEYSHWIWRQYASAFWSDVRIDHTLGSGASLYSANKAEKEDSDEKHMHPLQLDIIERCLVMWSNPGEVVLTPFMGIGSEVYGAVINGRKGVGVELKSAYYQQALQNIREAAKVTPEGEERSLFDELKTDGKETASMFGDEEEKLTDAELPLLQGDASEEDEELPSPPHVPQPSPSSLTAPTAPHGSGSLRDMIFTDIPELAPVAALFSSGLTVGDVLFKAQRVSGLDLLVRVTASLRSMCDGDIVGYILNDAFVAAAHFIADAGITLGEPDVIEKKPARRARKGKKELAADASQLFDKGEGEESSSSEDAGLFGAEESGPYGARF